MTRTRGDDGFTLVELLVVVVILGVLAAIAMPALLDNKQRAYRSALVSDARSLMTAQASRLADQVGYTESLAALESDGFTLSGGVEEPRIKVVGNTYTACMKHPGLSEWLVLDGTEQQTDWAADDTACA